MSIYGSLLLRQSGDLDILVKKQDFLRAKNLLLQHDYLEPYAPWLNKIIETGKHPYSHEYPLSRQDGKVTIDLHRSLTGKDFYCFPSSFEHSVWDRVEPVSLLGPIVNNLSTNDLLLHLCVHGLCVHGCKHLWERLAWLCDLTELIQGNPSLDWSGLIQDSRDLGCDRILLVNLCLCHDLLETPLHQIILEYIETDPVVKSLSQELQNQMFDNVPNVETTVSSKQIKLYLKMMTTWQSKVAYLLEFYWRYLTIPSNKDISSIKLPAPLYGLYYLIQPIRIANEIRFNVQKALLG